MRKSRQYRRAELFNDPYEQNPKNGVDDIFDAEMVFLIEKRAEDEWASE